jgi:hypothetical protein
VGLRLWTPPTFPALVRRLADERGIVIIVQEDIDKKPHRRGTNDQGLTLTIGLGRDVPPIPTAKLFNPAGVPPAGF